MKLSNDDDVDLGWKHLNEESQVIPNRLKVSVTQKIQKKDHGVLG